ncbi:hypothetical protein QYE76_030394 [Lolium multiflorum]|uniref:Uncharacterized protein n=1 Tax=Lolium multiflorum TaxID=4521 RepID=A0AAD8QPU1_LOLMU|nr:hypothetical protein QYE76_030394 [Lolium multiflorum]
MEATLLSVGKSVLNGALGYAKSTVAEEVALQLGVRRDQAFITDELEMMQGFLMAANDEGDDNKVVTVWVKQVRDVSYEVEDCLLDFAVRLEKQSWWSIPRKLLDRRHVAQRMKELRVKVEDVNKRNLRYRLVNGPSASSNPTPTSAAAGQSSSASMTMFGIDEAGRAAKLNKTNLDLVKLINKKDDDLRVISVWGTCGDIGQASIIRAAYENTDLKVKFACRAWVRVMHPFNPREFVQSLLKQFHAAVQDLDDLLETEKTGQDLALEFKGYVNEKSYLIVLTDLSTVEEWDQIKVCFPNNKKGSRIIVSTMQAEVASLCVGEKSIVSELKQLSAQQTIYAFQDKGSHSETNFSTESSSTTATTDAVPTCISGLPATRHIDRSGQAGVNGSLTKLNARLLPFPHRQPELHMMEIPSHAYLHILLLWLVLQFCLPAPRRGASQREEGCAMDQVLVGLPASARVMVPHVLQRLLTLHHLIPQWNRPDRTRRAGLQRLKLKLIQFGPGKLPDSFKNLGKRATVWLANSGLTDEFRGYVMEMV